MRTRKEKPKRCANRKQSLGLDLVSAVRTNFGGIAITLPSEVPQTRTNEQRKPKDRCTIESRYSGYVYVGKIYDEMKKMNEITDDAQRLTERFHKQCPSESDTIAGVNKP